MIAGAQLVRLGRRLRPLHHLPLHSNYVSAAAAAPPLAVGPGPSAVRAPRYRGRRSEHQGGRSGGGHWRATMGPSRLGPESRLDRRHGRFRDGRLEGGDLAAFGQSLRSDCKNKINTRNDNTSRVCIQLLIASSSLTYTARGLPLCILARSSMYSYY